MPSPADAVRRLLSGSAVFLGTVLLGVLAGAMYGSAKTPVFTADAYVVAVAAPPADDATAVKFAQAYGRIAVDPAVLAQPGSRVSGNAGELRRQARVSTSPDAPLVQITGSADSAARAADIANQVAGELIRFGNARTRRTRVTLSSFAEAAPPDRQASPNVRLDIAVGGAAGVLVGGFAVTAGVGTRRRRRTEVAPAAPASAPAAPATSPVNGRVVGHDLAAGQLEPAPAPGSTTGDER